MNAQWRGLESDHQAEERVRVCTDHSRVCVSDEKRDRIVCPMGHEIAPAEGRFAVMTRSKAEALAPRGGTMTQGVRGSGLKKGTVSSIESSSFTDGAGWRLRITLRVNKGRHEVFVWHLSPDQKTKKSGVLDAFEMEAAARTRFNAEIQKARAKGWLPSLNRRGGGGLKEIPDPQPAKASQRGGASKRDPPLKAVARQSAA